MPRSQLDMYKLVPAYFCLYPSVFPISGVGGAEEILHRVLGLPTFIRYNKEINKLHLCICPCCLVFIYKLITKLFLLS
jgi:hypothetical protein